MIEELKNIAKELLRTKKADVIIGYARASDGISATPAFIYDEKDADRLIWDAYCVYNLSSYLNPVRNIEMLGRKSEISNGVKELSGKKVGIIAKACDVKSILVLLQENQLKREDIIIIGVECSGMIDEKRLRLNNARDPEEMSIERKCKECQTRTPLIYDHLVKDKEGKTKTLEEKDAYESIRKLEAKSLGERLKFWSAEFSRCIRCYACRQVCPLCYCPVCVADQTMPAWFSKATSLEGNFSWNVVRAMHLAGRCIDCGECERACPVGIPLRDINKKIEKDIKELFGYEAPSGAEKKPLFASFDKNDPEKFIR